MNHYGKHFVAIIGGSVAGSEAAYMLAGKGIRVVVFDQKDLPYGKIEDGLPKWHAGLRDKEEKLIDERLSHEGVRFVPRFKLGRDATLDELINDWGFSAIIIAIGAWKDRMIPVEGIESYINHGLIKQNDLLHWFNHYHEPSYDGIRYQIPDGTGVVGGGLASLDVVKIVMIELVQKALKEQLKVEVDMFTLEKKGVAKILEANNTSLEKLGLKGCTLFYRRNAEDMPLYPRKGETSESVEKAKRVSEKLLTNYQNKFLFNFEPMSVPIAVSGKNGQLSGMTFQRVKSENGKLVDIPGETFEFKTDLIISSIGSLPQDTPSLPLKGSMLKTYGEFGCRVEGYENVFAIGNVVTGRGNIIESKKHGRKITETIIDEHLASEAQDPMAHKYDTLFREIEADADRKLGNIVGGINGQPTEPDDKINEILAKTETLQRKVGYTGDYMTWANDHRPVRLEQLLEQHSK
jgi:NADPH-dependent glutamate synthase beta subunit-like oxidoreductase